MQHNAFSPITTARLTSSRQNVRQWNRAKRSRRLTLLVTLPILINFSACIVLPVGIGEENLLTEKKLDFIENGKTTKEEIASAMSKHLAESGQGMVGASWTPAKFRDGDWWLYTQTRKESRWLVWLYGDGGITGDEDLRFLLAKFDSSGVVADYVVSSSEGKGCNENHVCVGGSYPPQLLAPFTEDRVAKQFEIPKDRCGLYVYGTPRDSHPLFKSLPIWLDGRQVGLIVDRKQYFFWELDPGRHVLATLSPGVVVKKHVNLRCKGGIAYFYELATKEVPQKLIFVNRWIEVEWRSTLTGRTVIRKRWLTLKNP